LIKWVVLWLWNVRNPGDKQMKSLPVKWLLGVIGASALMLVPESVMAQGAGANVLRIRRIEGTMVRTPVYNTQDTTRSSRQRQWLQVRTEYETAPDWLSEATFTYYILLRNSRPPAGEQEFNLFKGEVTYVNIARTRTGASTVFMHPSSIERFGSVERVAVVITSQGRVIGMESNPSSNDRWWERVTPLSGFVMNRSQSPFAHIEIDNFEAIKMTP